MKLKHQWPKIKKDAEGTNQNAFVFDTWPHSCLFYACCRNNVVFRLTSKCRHYTDWGGASFIYSLLSFGCQVDFCSLLCSCSEPNMCTNAHVSASFMPTVLFSLCTLEINLFKHLVLFFLFRTKRWHLLVSILNAIKYLRKSVEKAQNLVLNSHSNMKLFSEFKYCNLYLINTFFRHILHRSRISSSYSRDI